MEFVTKQERWLNDKVGSHDPEDIDLELSTVYRLVYKLEKSMSEHPVTKSLAHTVCIHSQLLNKSVFYLIVRDLKISI